jgi:type I restriction enzyme S subunit
MDNIPLSWSIMRNKVFLLELNTPSLSGEEELLTVSQYTGITKRKDRLTEVTDLLTTAKTLKGYKIVEKEAMVMNIMLAWNGSLGISPFNGIVSPAYCVFRINKNLVFPKFLHYLHRTRLYTGVFETASTGVIKSRLRLYPEKYLALKSVLPPIEDQKQIAKYLDWKTTQIAKFIKAKKRQIELLKEQKQVIINDAVTGKIDVATGKPYSKYKESGVKWLGKIPNHWNARRLKHCIKFLTDYTANGSFADLAKNVTYREDGFARLVRLTDLRDDFKNKGVYIDENAYKYLAKSKLYGGELLIANVGAYAGYSFVVPKNLSFNASLGPNMYVIFFNKLMNSDFANFLLNSDSILNSILLMATSTAQPKLNKNNVKEATVPIPPVSEQIALLKYLNDNTTSINNAIFKIESEINLIKEYKNSMINETITGKVDIRDIKVAYFEEDDTFVEMEETSDIEDVLDESTVDIDL